MAHHSSKYIQFTYPDDIKIKGYLPDTMILKSSSKDEMSIFLKDERIDFINFYNKRYNPDSNKFIYDHKEIIKSGDCSSFPGAKEIVIKETDSKGNIVFYWNILIKTGDRIIEIKVSMYDNLSGIDKLWKNIINSMKFDINLINKIRNNNIEYHGLTEKSNIFTYNFFPYYSFIGIYDFSIRLFEECEDDEEDEEDEYTEIMDFLEDLAEKSFSKYDKRLVLRPRYAVTDLITTFYINEELPSDQDYFYIIEGTLGIPFGKLYGNAGDGPELEIKVKPGVYKFRVYWGEYNAEDDEEYLRIYFWSTDEPETNEVKIIKPYEGGYGGTYIDD